MEKLKIRQAVIVEGKYDKIALEPVLDAVILATDGFRVFKDKEMQRLIRELAGRCGIVALTDSDAAGFKIRALLSGIVRDGELVNVYIPDIIGKERRKRARSAEGKLGVEGMSPAVLREAFLRAGVLPDERPESDAITAADFYELGLSGGGNSANRRRALFARLGLPARLSSKSAVQVLNRTLSKEELEKLVRELP